MNEFRDVMREPLKRYGREQREVADRAGVSDAWLSRVVTGKSPMTKRMLAPIIVALKEMRVQPFEIAQLAHVGAKRLLADLGVAEITALRGDRVLSWLKPEVCFGDAPTGIQIAALRRQINDRRNERQQKGEKK